MKAAVRRSGWPIPLGHGTWTIGLILFLGGSAGGGKSLDGARGLHSQRALVGSYHRTACACRGDSQNTLKRLMSGLSFSQVASQAGFPLAEALQVTLATRGVGTKFLLSPLEFAATFDECYNSPPHPRILSMWAMLVLLLATAARLDSDSWGKR